METNRITPMKHDSRGKNNYLKPNIACIPPFKGHKEATNQNSKTTELQQPKKDQSDFKHENTAIEYIQNDNFPTKKKEKKSL